MINGFDSFVKICDNISKKNNFSSIWFGGIGLGFNKDREILKKLYFNFEKNIDLETFPFKEKVDLYSSFLPFLDSTRCAYNSIAIKKNIIDNKFTNYFHLKFNKNFLFEKKDKALGIDLSKNFKAVSVEFDSTITYIKRYYYIYDKEDISKLLKVFNIKESAEKIAYLEYTHSPKKVILIYNNVSDVFQGIKNNFSNTILHQVESIYKKYNTLPSLYGKYLINYSAIYWDLYKSNFNIIDVIYE